ncbi:uncharacterized protein LOC118748470 isoform X1 [Rhagoletis pomonella]|uniref:uncharacterized protein LOC118748470 isoform X1 n=1 Tax=Rhagoletis pomonella TaxID=28610 RepID=UPI001783C508|nr:uncharacterized protein LOC118748470 isoform X1 [Rhagoletis pomonella]
MCTAADYYASVQSKRTNGFACLVTSICSTNENQREYPKPNTSSQSTCGVEVKLHMYVWARVLGAGLNLKIMGVGATIALCLPATTREQTNIINLTYNTNSLIIYLALWGGEH